MWESDGKGAAFAFLALHLDRSTMPRHNLFDHIEADAHTGKIWPLRIRSPEEALEELSLGGCRDAYAVIGHREYRVAIASPKV